MKARDSKFEGIIDLVRSLDGIQRRAAQQYEPVVDDILRNHSQDVEHIERTLDRLLDFCGFDPVLAMYKRLCRHYWDIDPAATAYYINAYREYWDSDRREEQP